MNYRATISTTLKSVKRFINRASLNNAFLDFLLGMIVLWIDVKKERDTIGPRRKNLKQ